MYIYICIYIKYIIYVLILFVGVYLNSIVIKMIMFDLDIIVKMYMVELYVKCEDG